MKTLKLFNGGDWTFSGGHLYIGAYSVTDAARLMEKARQKIRGATTDAELSPETEKFFVNRNVRLIKTYFNEGCWGKTMAGITPERGVWYAPRVAGGFHDEKAERVI